MTTNLEQEHLGGRLHHQATHRTHLKHLQGEIHWTQGLLHAHQMTLSSHIWELQDELHQQPCAIVQQEDEDLPPLSDVGEDAHLPGKPQDHTEQKE